MEILEGAMAFAVAMIIFSTMATGIVEVLLRCTHTKSAFLHQSVKKMLQDMAASQFDGAVRPDETQIGDTANALTVNPARLEGWFETTWIGRAWYTWSDKDGNRYRIDALSTVAFVKRLSETELGATIAAQARKLAPADEIEKGVSEKFAEWQSLYERYRATANERFRKNAQGLTVLVAVLMALVFNIHAGRLFEGIMANESAELRETLIAGADQAQADNAAAEAKLQATLDALTAAAADGADPSVTADLQSQLAEVEALLQPTATTDLMRVGPAYFPHCHFSQVHQDAPTCERSKTDVLGWLQWAGNALLAGILIGLGGPFWYRVFSSLSQLTQALKAFGSRKGGSAEMLGGTVQLRPEQLPDDTDQSDLQRASAAALQRSDAQTNGS